MTTGYRQLQPEECVTLASLLQQGHSLRSIAKVLERSPRVLSTCCDEVESWPRDAASANVTWP
jgi:IS30 family transposase